MRQKAVILLFILIAFLFGVICESTWSAARRMATGSSRFALETSLKKELKKHHENQGRYPDSLDEIQIDWLKDPERRKVLLRDFYYENRGSSYVLWWPRNLTGKD